MKQNSGDACRTSEVPRSTRAMHELARRKRSCFAEYHQPELYNFTLYNPHSFIYTEAIGHNPNTNNRIPYSALGVLILAEMRAKAPIPYDSIRLIPA